MNPGNTSGCALACLIALGVSEFAAHCAPLADKSEVQPEAEPGRIALKSGDRVVFFGDSITAWAGSMRGKTPVGFLAQMHHYQLRDRADMKLVLINAGVPGHGVADLRDRLDRDVFVHKPAVVVVYIGINDVWTEESTMSADEYGQRLSDLVGRIGKAGARVVLCTLSVIGEKKSGGNPYDRQLDEFSEICRKVARESGSVLCDLRKAFVERLAANNPGDLGEGVLTEDGVHLNEAGNRLVAVEMAKALGIGGPESNAEDR